MCWNSILPECALGAGSALLNYGSLANNNIYDWDNHLVHMRTVPHTMWMTLFSGLVIACADVHSLRAGADWSMNCTPALFLNKLNCMNFSLPRLDFVHISLCLAVGHLQFILWDWCKCFRPHVAKYDFPKFVHGLLSCLTLQPKLIGILGPTRYSSLRTGDGPNLCSPLSNLHTCTAWTFANAMKSMAFNHMPMAWWCEYQPTLRTHYRSSSLH